MSDNYQHELAHALISEQRQRDALRAEVARLQDALAQATDAETDAVQRAQEAERELAACQSLRRKHQRYALRQTGKLKEARGAIGELLDYLKRVVDYRAVDANELDEFIAKTRAMYGIQESQP